jgi:hypothetical protein
LIVFCCTGAEAIKTVHGLALVISNFLMTVFGVILLLRVLGGPSKKTS